MQFLSRLANARTQARVNALVALLLPEKPPRALCEPLGQEHGRSIPFATNIAPQPNVRFQAAGSTGRRNTMGQMAINNDDRLPNARPNAFSETLRNQLSHAVICSAAFLPPRKPMTYRPIIDLFPQRQSIASTG